MSRSQSISGKFFINTTTPEGSWNQRATCIVMMMEMTADKERGEKAGLMEADS